MSDVSKTNELIAEARDKSQFYGDTDSGPLLWELADALEAATRVPVQGEPGACLNHKPVQHRDGKPPWCRVCGLDARGNEPESRLGRHVKGEPNDDREAKAEALEAWQSGNEMRQYSEFFTSWEDGYDVGRAAVPDAATGNVQKMYDRACADIQEYSETIKQLEAERDAAHAAIDAVRTLHRRSSAVVSRDGLRFDDPCPDCDGKAGVHDCGCWADTDAEFVCSECFVGSKFESVAWPCPTIAALDGAPEPEVKP